MTASLRVKNDKYYVVLTHTTDGKKNQTWISTGLSVTGNEGKARQIMLDMLGEKPEQAAPHDILFSDAVRRWLEDVRHRVDEVTYQGYEVQARAHILPYFDDLQIRLCDVDGETLQTYINVKAKFGRSDGHGGLSAVSLRQHKNVLNQTLKLAQRDGLIQTNPANLVVMPHAAQFTGTFYTEAQMRDLLTAVKNERLYPIIYVTALYGLRRSEVLGLKWDSINFAMQTLTIRHTVARVTKVVEKNKTKNASSFRSFPLTDDAVRLFKILLQQEQYYRNHFGKDYIDNDYVFTWEDGHPYSPDYVSHTFHKLLKKYDLPHIRFHDLRHPYVKHTTKKYNSEKLKTQATKIDLIAWVFRFVSSIIQRGHGLCKQSQCGCRGIHMIVDMSLVDVCADDKGVFALGEPLGKFHAETVGFFRGDLPRAEGLADMVGDHIVRSTDPSGGGNILALC